MTTPLDDAIKKAIDEQLEPLVDDHHRYLAGSIVPAMSVSRAELLYVYNQYNEPLLDFSSPMTPVGHKHPFVHNAVKEHMEYYIHTAPVGEHVLRWPVEYARDIVETFTDEDAEPKHQVLFTEGERDAVRVAIDIALENSDSLDIAAIDTGIHDRIDGNFGVDLIPVDTLFLKEFSWTNVAAVLISLVTYDGKSLDPRWVQEVVNQAKNVQTMVIIDESLTGFGRFGTTWGQQTYNIEADLTVLGGPVGGGLALGAIVAKKDYFSRLYEPLSPQAGSPVACAAGAGTLRAVNPGVLEHVRAAGQVLDESLLGLVSQFPEFLANTHGTGLWRTLEFHRYDQARQFSNTARRHGLLLAPPVGSSLVLTPPLIISTLELKRGVDLMADTLLEVQDS